jgi:hypothetical protein
MTILNIATNPDTGVRYYADPGALEGRSVDLFVPLRGDTVTNPGGTHWPNLFGLPYEEQGLKFYLKGSPKLREYDPEMLFEIAAWGPVEYAAPKAGGPAGTWEETVEVLRHSEEVLLNQVEAYRLQANSQLYPSSEDPLLSVLLADAIQHDRDNTATREMRELLIRHQGMVAAGFKNLERARVLRQQIQGGEAFSLSEGWTYEPLPLQPAPGGTNEPPQ